VTVEEVEGENRPRRLSAHLESSSSNTIIEEIPHSESATPTGASKEKKKVRNYIDLKKTILMQYCL
jgi:hypothetical protein